MNLIYLISLFIGTVQLLFWLSTYFLRKGIKESETYRTTELEPLTVILSARNEAHNLSTFLPHILSQDYPNFEIIVINDDSTDHSSEVLDHYMAQYVNLRVINMKNKDREGKKQALQEGIKQAKYEWLVFTDADCYPQSNQWLRSIAAKCKEKTDIILGYSPYQKGKGYLNDFIRYETLMTAVIYGTFTQLGMPYMGVGRNMAYRKSRFLEKVDKEKFEKISFGDDDIAVNAMANSQNTALQFTEKARVMSLAKATLPDFIKQKTRHISSSAYYKPNHQWLLSLLAISQAIFYPFLFFLVFYNTQAAIYLFIFRMTIFLPNSILLMRKMECKDLIHKAILMDFLFFLYYWYVSFRWISTKKISWN